MYHLPLRVARLVFLVPDSRHYLNTLRLFKKKKLYWVKLAIACGTPLVVVIARFILTPLLPFTTTPFLFGLLSVVLSALIAGFLSAMVTMVLIILATIYFSFAPIYSFKITTASQALSLGIFISQAIWMSWIIEVMRTSLYDADTKTQMLSMSEQRLKFLIEGVRDYATYTTDAQGYITTWNAGGRRLTGYTEDDVVGKHFSMFFIDEDIEERRPWHLLHEVGMKEKLVDEGWRVKKNGTRYWAKITVLPIKDDKGKIVGYTCLSRDLTRFREASAALRRSESRFKRLFESDIICIFIADFNGTVIEANKAYLSLLGYTREDLVSHMITWADITPPEYAEKDAEAIKEAKEKGICSTYEKEYIHRDGHRIPILIGYALIEGYKDRCIGFVLNITERKMLEQRKDEFISVASHELKTPLTSIKAFAQILQQHMDRIYDEQSQLYLKKMEVQINRLTDLVSDLLDVSRIQAGKLELHKEHFQFDEMVKSVTDNLAPVLNNHSIEIQKNESVTVYADRSRLEQVLINLITNAVKYSPGVDKIIIRIEKKKGFIRTSVHDFGIGIPKDKQKKIFDRFYRVKGPRGERFQGLGLGLYISAEIVRRHDGEISFESTEGKGSIFYFTLPL